MTSAFAAAITGFGVLSPIGVGVPAFVASLDEGRHGMTRLRRFARDGYRQDTVAVLGDPRWDRLLAMDAPIEGPDPVALAALDAAWMAFTDARLEHAQPERIAFMLGSSAAGLYSRSRFERRDEDSAEDKRALLARASHGAVTTWVADALGHRGPRCAFAPACSSSAHAIAHGWDLLREGRVDVVIAGGVELMVEEIFAGFHGLGLIADGPCAPFSSPEGMTVGEGAAFVVLERERTARARGATVRGYLSGYGLSLDAFHAITPAPNGSGVARAMIAALSCAGLSPDEIGYVNAHGTGTSTNDASEWRAIQRVFGPRAERIPVSATKSSFGHTQAAAGALEFAATVLCLERSKIPPTLHYRGPRPCSPADAVAEERPRAAQVERALCCKSAFGGSNSALVYSRRAPANASVEPAPASPAPIAVLGDALLVASEPFKSPLVDDAVIDAALRAAQTRGFDRLSRLVSASTSMAAKEARLPMSNAARERTGLVTVLHRPSGDSADEFWKSVREGGFCRASPNAFARMVLSTVQGCASLALDVQGPSSVVSGGLGASLAALLLARAMLTYHSNADALLLGAAQESSRIEREVLAAVLDRWPIVEHAACFALARPTRETTTLIVGLAAEPPGSLARAATGALIEAGLDASSLGAVFLASDGAREDDLRARESLAALRWEAPVFEPAERFGVSAASDAVALAVALRDARARATDGDGRPALVLAENRALGSFAAVVRAQGAPRGAAVRWSARA